LLSPSTTNLLTTLGVIDPYCRFVRKQRLAGQGEPASAIRVISNPGVRFRRCGRRILKSPEL
jgi:hypothetical protein